MKIFGQKKGINFLKNFSLMVKIFSIRVVFSFAISLNLKIE